MIKFTNLLMPFMVFSGFMAPPPKVHNFIASGRNTRRNFIISSTPKRSNEPQTLLQTYPTAVEEMKGTGRISTAAKESIKQNKSEIIKSGTQGDPSKTNMELETEDVTTATLKSVVSPSAKASVTEIVKSSTETSTTTGGNGVSDYENISTITMKSTMDDSTEISNNPDEKASTLSSSSSSALDAIIDEIRDATLDAQESVNSEIKLDTNSSKEELVKYNVLKVIRRSGAETEFDEDTNSKMNTTTNTDMPVFIDNQSDSKATDNSENNNSRSAGNLTAVATDRTGEMPSIIADWKDLSKSHLETDNGSNSNIGGNSNSLLEPQIIVEEANKNDILESYTAFTTVKSVSEAESFSLSDTYIEILIPNSSDVNSGDVLVEDTRGEIFPIEVDRFD